MLALALPLSICLLVAASLVLAFVRSKRLGFVITTALFALIAVLSAILLSKSYFGIEFSVFSFSSFSLFFSLIFSIFFLLINTLAYSSGEKYSSNAMLLGVAAFGIFLIIFSLSLLELFLGMEIAALVTSFMVIISGRDRAAPALKLFLASSLAAAIIALALALVIPYQPHLSISEIFTYTAAPYAVALPVVLLVSGLLFAAGAFPFSIWLPDVYDAAPTHLAAMLASINRNVAFVAVIEAAFVLFAIKTALLSNIFLIISVLTMFFGNILAMREERLNRLLAYASMAQAGYLMVGLAALTAQGLASSIFYIAVDGIAIIGSYGILIWLNENSISTLAECRGLFSKSAICAICFTILMLSMAGMPLLAGFAGLLLLFTSSASAGLLALVAIALINTALSLYYYGRIMNRIFASGRREEFNANLYIVVVVVACVAAVVVFGIHPGPLIKAASQAALSLPI